jgi:hypothetical protein
MSLAHGLHAKLPSAPLAQWRVDTPKDLKANQLIAVKGGKGILKTPTLRQRRK